MMAWAVGFVLVWFIISRRIKKLEHLIITLTVLLVIASILCQISHYQKENFVDEKDSANAVVATTGTLPKTTINDMLRETGFTDIIALRNFLNGIYDENLQQITYDNALTLYYSVFSTSSLPMTQTRTWRNISPFFKSESSAQSCKITFPQTHLDFGEIPYSNRYVGLELVSNSISGPESHQLGIQGNGTFSMFTLLKFNSFSPNNNKPYELFKLYGNTVSNNAVSLTINPQPIALTQPSTLLPTTQEESSGTDKTTSITLATNTVPVVSNVYNVQMDLSFGSHTTTASMSGSTNIPIVLGTKYMFVVTKTNTRLVLNMYDMSTMSAPLINLVNTELAEPTVLLSNKRFSINTEKNLNANVYAFGVYNINLLDELFLQQYLFKELYKMTDEFMSMLRAISSFQQSIDDIKACPYTEAVCSKCEINDWTDFQQIIASSPECRDAIDAHCSKNLTDPRCSCWDPNTTSAECKSYVNIFRSKACLNVENLDIESLSQVKKKYNLCDCTDIDKIKNSLKESGACPNPDITVSNPYKKTTPDDITFYDKSLVTNNYDGLLKEATMPSPSLLENSSDQPAVPSTTEGTRTGFFSWLMGRG
jgi:hypothetical protein